MTNLIQTARELGMRVKRLRTDCCGMKVGEVYDAEEDVEDHAYVRCILPDGSNTGSHFADWGGKKPWFEVINEPELTKTSDGSCMTSIIQTVRELLERDKHRYIGALLEAEEVIKKLLGELTDAHEDDPYIVRDDFEERTGARTWLKKYCEEGEC